MRRVLRLNRRGISPVISTIILSAVVMAIGGAVWSYSQSVSVSIAKDYVEGVTSLMDEVVERFTVEHVAYNNVSKILKVWIYNYGGIDVVVDVYANNGSMLWSDLSNTIGSKSVNEVDMSISARRGAEVAIKVVSRRGNIVYYTYVAS